MQSASRALGLVQPNRGREPRPAGSTGAGEQAGVWMAVPITPSQDGVGDWVRPCPSLSSPADANAAERRPPPPLVGNRASH